jgi:hypothetical protein
MADSRRILQDVLGSLDVPLLVPGAAVGESARLRVVRRVLSRSLGGFTVYGGGSAPHVNHVSRSLRRGVLEHAVPLSSGSTCAPVQFLSRRAKTLVWQSQFPASHPIRPSASFCVPHGGGWKRWPGCAPEHIRFGFAQLPLNDLEALFDGLQIVRFLDVQFLYGEHGIFLPFNRSRGAAR